MRIWGDRWLPTPTSFQVQSRVYLLPKDAIVHNLIEVKTHNWKREFLPQFFSEEEVETISHIPVNMFGALDKITWWPTRNGVFSVKFTYYLELKQVRKTSSKPSTKGTKNQMW